MGTRVKESATVNFDIPPRSFAVILLITFDFQHFLTKGLYHNPYIIELISMEFLVQIKRHKKEKDAFDL